MKICHLVLGKGNPDRANGINRIAHELCVAQRSIGLDAEMWGWTPDPESPTTERPYPLVLQRRAPLRFAPAAGFTGALDELAAPVVFHLHGALLPEWSAAARALRARKLPWVITPHGSWTKPALQRSPHRKRAFLTLFDRGLAEGALAVQVNGEAERADTIELFPRARVIAVPNGQAPLPQPAQPEVLRFVFCGRLDIAHKGLDLLIDGFVQHVSRGGGGELVLIGEGADRGSLEARAEPVGDRVRFLGPLFGEEKLHEIGAASLFLHSSRHEGMPVAVLEAAALSRPLALSSGTNLLEAFDQANACLPIRPNTPQAIAEVFARACALDADQRLASYGERARSLVEKDYTWESAARKLLEGAYSLHSKRGEVAA